MTPFELIMMGDRFLKGAWLLTDTPVLEVCAPLLELSSY